MAHWSTQTHSVRERFGLGVVLLATVYCSVALTLLRAMRAPWTVIIFWFGLVLLVAAAQFLARRLGAPRTVSAVVGGANAVAWTIATQAYAGALGTDPVVLGVIAVVGAACGYFAGAVVASVFLVHDFLHDTFRAKRLRREALREAMGQGPSDSPWDEPP